MPFHGICPPIFIQTWLQQYGRGVFFYSAHCSFSNPICFWSVWCCRKMFPGKIFTSSAKFQGIASVNDFGLPCWLQELLQTPLCFLRSFCFARICLEPLGCPSPAGRTAYRRLFRDSQPSLRTLWSAVIKSPKFPARSTTLPMRLLQGDLVILVVWQISQFLSLGKWVLTLCSPKSTLLEGVGSKDGSWEELACEYLRSRTLSSTNFLWILASIPVWQNTTGRPVLIVVFVCIWFWIFGWLGQQRVSRSFWATCELDTSTGWESIPLRSSALLYLRDCLWTPLTTLGDRANDFSLHDCCAPFYFLFWFS